MYEPAGVRPVVCTFVHVAPVHADFKKMRSPIMPGVFQLISIPGVMIEPSDGLTRLAPFSGSMFGIIQGLTHRGCTGTIVPATLAEFDGLNASAVALALTVALLFPQMREKKVGKFVRVTVTPTTGFTPKAGGRVPQSDVNACVGPGE
jgi:hypothetical protein